MREEEDVHDGGGGGGVGKHKNLSKHHSKHLTGYKVT